MRLFFLAEQLPILEPTTQHKKVDLEDRQQTDSCGALNSASRIARHQHTAALKRETSSVHAQEAAVQET